MIRQIDKLDSLSFNGKFIKKGSFNTREESLINAFINYGKNGKTNASLIEQKPYDIYVSKKAQRIELESSFKMPFIVNPLFCNISILDDSGAEINTELFRVGLDLFEDYKKQHNGYNTFFEKIIAYFKDLG